MLLLSDVSVSFYRLFSSGFPSHLLQCGSVSHVMTKTIVVINRGIIETNNNAHIDDLLRRCKASLKQKKTINVILPCEVPQ